MNKAQKSEEIKNLTEIFEAAKIVVLADYKGVNVADISQLRRDVRAAGGGIRVSKNTLVKRVLNKETQGPFYELCVGQNAIAYSDSDPVGVVKTLVEFAKKNPKLKVKGGLLEGTSHLSEENLANLAKLPGREDLLAMLMGALDGPIRSVMGVMNNNVAQLLMVLKGIEEKVGEESSP